MSFLCPSMDMERWVTKNNEIRTDLSRFHRSYGQRAMDMWVEYANLHSSFEVPKIVDVPLSFTRDELYRETCINTHKEKHRLSGLSS